VPPIEPPPPTVPALTCELEGETPLEDSTPVTCDAKAEAVPKEQTATMAIAFIIILCIVIKVK
jgi:hypothetical protein